jgi:hypothetical protein
MIRIRVGVLISLLFAAWVLPTSAQQSPATNVIVPPLVKFGGLLSDVNGKPLAGIVGVTFCLYKDSQGGVPLWMETQNVQSDKTGHYSVMLGSTTSQGLPADLFVSGEARWLGVQIEAQEEQPRIMLLSVPYAMKAGDAETVGGLPASAFVLAAPPSSLSSNSGSATEAGAASSSASGAPPPAGTLTGAGTTDFIPLWTSSSNIGNSALFQSGTGSTAKLGINTTTPGATLDVKGGTNIEGLLDLPATGTATATAGKNSQAQDFVASAFNSSTVKAVAQTFQWHAEPAGNNTSAPSGTLNLLFGSGTSSPAETGLTLSSKGLFTFAIGQTFPGTGTLTGVTTASGSGLTGGGTGGTLNLALTNACAASQVLQWNGTAWACSSAGTGTITGITAGTDLTGGGKSGTVTLNLDTTKIPQLGAANTFTGNQTVKFGNLTVMSAVPTVIGNPGCGGFFGGIGFGADSLSGCTNYSLLGDAINTYLNRPNGGQIVFRENNATEMVLASGGNVGIGTISPQYPLHVNGTVRADTGLSLGGNATLSVDAPGKVGGQFLVANGTVSIGGDTPMSSAPRMLWHGFLPGDLGSVHAGGEFIPDKGIRILRVSAWVDSVGSGCSTPAAVTIINAGIVLSLSGDFNDTGSISVSSPAGTQLAIENSPPSGCGTFSSSGSNVNVDVMYVMQ